jgi:two-component system chemotaxis response regulator CheB
LRALELGAVDFVLKYTPGAPVSRASLRREIVSKVKIAAASKSSARLQKVAAAPPVPVVPALRAPIKPAVRTDAGPLVVIGASTGGPRAVGEVLSQLPDDFATPCVVVQHLPATFTVPFASQLERHTSLRIKVAETGDRPEPGVVLVAPGSTHLSFRADGRIQLQTPDAADIYRPSINLAMTSAARNYGASVVGVLLTGAGDDGAAGMKEISDGGGECYVQDPATCVVSSMPERAIERGAVDHVATPERIGNYLAVRRTP